MLAPTRPPLRPAGRPNFQRLALSRPRTWVRRSGGVGAAAAAATRRQWWRRRRRRRSPRLRRHPQQWYQWRQRRQRRRVGRRWHPGDPTRLGWQARGCPPRTNWAAPPGWAGMGRMAVLGWGFLCPLGRRGAALRAFTFAIRRLGGGDLVVAKESSRRGKRLWVHRGGEGRIGEGGGRRLVAGVFG